MSAKRRAAAPPSPSSETWDEKTPRNLDAERAVLGSILVAGRDALESARRSIAADDFFDPKHPPIFATMEGLAAQGTEIDLVTVNAELMRSGRLEEVGGAAYVASLMDGLPHSANAGHYAGPVRDTKIRRDLMRLHLEAARACTNGHQTSELREAGADLYRRILAADPATVRRIRPMSEVAADYSKSVDRGKARKVWTGIGQIDTATAGLNPGEVLTGVARPQVGKSAVASQIIVNASRSGEPCLFVSLEMPREQAFERMAQQRLGVSRSTVEDLAAGDWAGLRPEQRDALDALNKSVVIVDVGKTAVAELDGAVMEAGAILGRPPRLIVIDYLGLLGSGSKNLPLYQRISEAAVDVKSFAKRHQAAVILLSQAGRDPDPKRSAGAAELGLDAARDSGQIEEAADFLLTLWRPELEPGLDPMDAREVAGQLHGTIAKNRRGPRPTFRLSFDLDTLRIADWPEES